MQFFRKLKVKIMLKVFGKFPKEAFSSTPKMIQRKCSTRPIVINPSENYIGTWEKSIAEIIANQLKKWGFRIRKRGRRINRFQVTDLRDIRIKDATHLAIYLR